MKILVAGTPGVGKTTLSAMLAQKTGAEHIDITAFVVGGKLYESYDGKLDTLVFDERSVNKELRKRVAKLDSFIIDTHTPSVARKIKFDFVFHVVCDRPTIAKRLEARGYSAHKVNCNLECEIFNTVGEELEELFDDGIYKINGSDLPSEEVEYDFTNIFDKIIQPQLAR